MQDRSVDAWGENTRSMSHTVQQSSICNDYGLPLKHDSFFYDHEPQLDSQIPRSGLALYGQDPAVPGLRSSALGRSGSALEVLDPAQVLCNLYEVLKLFPCSCMLCKTIVSFLYIHDS